MNLEEPIMSTAQKPPAIIDPGRADADEVIRIACAGKRVTDPELLSRIRERGEQARQTMLEKHGVTDVAVELIRAARDE